MGVGRLRAIAAALVAAGMPATTPVAVVARGTLPSQEVVAGTLATIADEVERRGSSRRP